MNQSWTHFQDLPVPLAPHPVCRRHRHAAEAVQEALRAHKKWQVWNVYPLLSATFKGHWLMITYLHNCRYLVGRRLVNYYHPNRRSSSSSSATAPSWSLISNDYEKEMSERDTSSDFVQYCEAEWFESDSQGSRKFSWFLAGIVDYPCLIFGMEPRNPVIGSFGWIYQGVSIVSTLGNLPWFKLNWRMVRYIRFPKIQIRF